MSVPSSAELNIYDRNPSGPTTTAHLRPSSIVVEGARPEHGKVHQQAQQLVVCFPNTMAELWQYGTKGRRLGKVTAMLDQQYEIACAIVVGVVDDGDFTTLMIADCPATMKGHWMNRGFPIDPDKTRAQQEEAGLDQLRAMRVSPEQVAQLNKAMDTLVNAAETRARVQRALPYQRYRMGYVQATVFNPPEASMLEDPNGHYALASDLQLVIEQRDMAIRLAEQTHEVAQLNHRLVAGQAHDLLSEFVACCEVGRMDGKLIAAAKDWMAQNPITNKEQDQ